MHFDVFLKRLRLVFPENPAEVTDIADMLQRQRECLHGSERRTLRFLPKVLRSICTRIQTLARSDAHTTAFSILRTASDDAVLSRVEKLKQQINHGRYRGVDTETDAAVLHALFRIWCWQLSAPLLGRDDLVSIAGAEDAESVLAQLSPVATAIVSLLTSCLGNVRDAV